MQNFLDWVFALIESFLAPVTFSFAIVAISAEVLISRSEIAVLLDDGVGPLSTSGTPGVFEELLLTEIHEVLFPALSLTRTLSPLTEVFFTEAAPTETLSSLIFVKIDAEYGEVTNLFSSPISTVSRPLSKSLASSETSR